MLGATLVEILSTEFNVFGTGFSDFNKKHINYMKFDLSNNSYEGLIVWSKPDIIIHCGAITNGNFCDQNPNSAFNVNGLSVKKLLDATTKKIKIIYISTDAVFPSKLHLAKEKDCVFPENIYGKSKELGEFFLLNSTIDYTIIRTTIVGLNLNKNKTGFAEWIINSTKNKEDINLFNDVIFTPISIWQLAKEIIFLIQNNYISSEILHIAGNEICTKYEFGRMLLKELNLTRKYIHKGSILKFKDRAKRCSDQTLDCTFYQKKYNRKLPNLLETVKPFK